MASAAGPYIVVRRDDGFGDVFPLVAGQRYTLGRSPTSRIVLKDDLCSREHAELYQGDGHWFLRDLNSLNGTTVNGQRLAREWELTPRDEVHIGHTDLVFVEDMSQLPDLPVEAPAAEHMLIKKRLGHTRFLTPIPALPPQDQDKADQAPPDARHRLSRDLALLYRLALDMGSAGTNQELVYAVLDGLLEGIAADGGAVLVVKEGQEPQRVANRHRDPNVKGYPPLPRGVMTEVLTSREGILAEDAARGQYLRDQANTTQLGTTTLLCVPITFNDRVLGLIHLYCTDPHKSLDTEDLEFAVAVGKQLGVAMHQLRQQASLRAENRTLRDQLRVESELVGASKAIKDIEAWIGRVAGTNATVLVRGESGTGKELVARAIHYSSPRREGPFVCLNCAALPETLLESELFGHEKGAFTGATEKKVGKFEAADHGTIFLDEIGEMNPATQAKLLRVLEGHPFERVGGGTAIRTDVRVVAATNQPLEQAVHGGTFRRDLFFRLQVVEIRVPPLREHAEDIPTLANHFLKRYALETGRKLRGFTPAALKKMQDYNWPGNVRELRNVVERAVALNLGPMLDADDIWLSSLDVHAPGTGSPYEPLSMDEVERQHILRTLQHTDWNKSQAAAILKIERSTLDRKIKLYDLKR
jgi:Nif-specific regulatory protein